MPFSFSEILMNAYIFLTKCIHTFPFSLVKDNFRFTIEKGYVPWMCTPEYPSPNPTRYFILDDDNESLNVLHDGTYKVSLQITYRKSSENSEEITLQHDIHLYTDAYIDTCPCSPTGKQSTSNTGGKVFL